MATFEWDETKNIINQVKHKVSFEVAQYAFFDENGIVIEDAAHSKNEKRFYCFGKVDNEIITVRFTYRKNVIRMFGAGYWREGKTRYEQKNKIHQ